MADVELNKIGEVIARVAASEGLELVHWELKGHGGGKSSAFLRILIDRPEGITHRDCVAVDNQVSAAFDAEDVIPFGYTLEVSSPGLGKALAGQPDFDRNRGAVVRVRAKEAVDGRSSFKGRVDHVTPREVTLVDGDGHEFTISYTNILAANVVQVPKGGRRAETGEETSDE
jgi:ribosome maturation factor RimP